MSISSELQILYLSIDEILWSNWDPIGINKVAPRDEYQSYTALIFNLKINQTSKETIANALYEIETSVIGMSGNIYNCEQVAEKIMNL